MINWSECPPLQAHRIRFLSSDGHVRDVMRYELDQARDVDPDLRVIATTPEEWESFLFEQKFIDLEWNKRKMLTESDVKFLSSCGIAWGDAASWKDEAGVPMWSTRGDE
jgi:hypothetical protein